MRRRDPVAFDPDKVEQAKAEQEKEQGPGASTVPDADASDDDQEFLAPTASPERWTSPGKTSSPDPRDSLQLELQPVSNASGGRDSLDLSKTKSQGSLDEDDYLPPRRSIRQGSVDTIDVDDYLTPTFNQFQQINPRDLSPPTEKPPPIPAVSYSPVKQ